MEAGIASSFHDYRPRHTRRILLVFPRYVTAFATFNHSFPLMGDVKAFMPPQGILLLAALVPKPWEVRFVDENIRPATPQEFAWADAVFISGMHIQRERIRDIARRSHAAGKIAALGGPSVSSAPEYYPDVDLLHCGEVGDATLRLFERLDDSVARPANQEVFQTVDRLPMSEFPCPAYHLVKVLEYLLGSIQYSSGCPFTCEFCDIPGIYGRNPRQKTPQQIIRELDQLASDGAVSVYFVDDNFIANPKAALELLPYLVEWQKRWHYTVRLSCEATLNISQHPKILELMREAYFLNVFCGIETPEPVALRAMKKAQNLRTPILDAVDILNSHGIEVASGIIMGLDTDTSDTPQAIIDFAAQSHVPILAVNLLYALPKTALYDRLQREGRLVSVEGRDSNIQFLQPYETVVANWRRVVSTVYEPSTLYSRYAAQSVKTYPNRIKPPDPLAHVSAVNLVRAANILRRLTWRVGICSDYRDEFWRMFWTQLKQGNIETIFQVSMVAHHLITYARECTQGRMQSSNYSARVLDARAEATATS
jgi:hopanoid C-2 methylase